MSGIEINRNSNPNTAISFDESAGEFRFERNGVVQSVEVDTFSIASNVTEDTSGDIQIRDDSSGQLFSLDDGDTGNEKLKAKYEGNGAFTFGQRSGTVGEFSFVFAGAVESLNSTSEASGDASVAFGRDHTVSGQGAAAFGINNVATGEASFVAGRQSEATNQKAVAFGTEASAQAIGSLAQGTNIGVGDGPSAKAYGSAALGLVTISKVAGKLSAGTFNEDYRSSAVNSIEEFSTDDRIFAVGVGDAPDSILYEFDGRGRVDGLYVTYRDGTYVRHGLQVDGYDGSNYVQRFKVNGSGVVNTTQNTADTSGDIQIRDNSSGDLFSLDDGSSPQLAARYEGVGAFTLGIRSTTDLFDRNPSAVTGSIVVGGGSAANDAVGSGAVAIGSGVTLGGFSVADNSVGIGNNIDVIGSEVFAVGKDIADNSTDGGNVFLGQGLTTSFEGTAIVGQYNKDIQASAGGFDGGFLVGTGIDDSSRETSLKVDSNGAYTSSLFLNFSSVDFTAPEAEASAVFGDASGIEDFSLEGSLVLTTDENSGIAISDSVNQSLIIESSVTTGGATDNVIAVDSDIQESFIGGLSYYSTYTGISAGVLENSWLFDVDVNSDVDITDRANYNIIFGSNKTVKANTRTNRLVLANGNVNADNSVAIRNATVSSPDTVGIGNKTFINAFDTNAFLVQDSSGVGNVFNVNTSNDEVQASQIFSNSASVADDGVSSFTPSQSFGKIVVQDGSGNVAEFLYDISNGAITKASDLTGVFTTSTSSLDGTTGTDGDITVSADSTNGEIDIENRTGSTKTFRWHLVG